MKNRLHTSSLLAAILLLASGLFAQEKHQTLFGNARIVGGFGGPIFEYGLLNGQFGTRAGGGGGLVVGDFFIGGFGMGTSDFAEVDLDPQIYTIDLGYGGFWLGYTPLTRKVIHPFGSLKVGWGTASLEYQKDDDWITGYEENIFSLTPEVGLELNIFRWFRISATGGYRFVNGADGLPDLDSRDFRSFIGTLTLRFGGFGSDQTEKEPPGKEEN